MEVLLAIQQRLKVPKAERNDFGGYNYRSLEVINGSIKPIADDYESLVVYTDEMIMIGDRYYIKAECRLMTPFGDLSAYGYARESLERKGMDPAQITGAASSYARKYAAQGLFALDGEADPDAMAPEPAPSAKVLNLYEVRCRECGNIGSQFTEENIKNVRCHTCGAVAWEKIK